MVAQQQQRPRRGKSRRVLFPSTMALLLLSLALALPTPSAAAAPTTTPDDDAGSSGGGHTGGGGGDEAAGRYPLMARLAPCLPLPVHSNCSQVPATLQQNLLTCTHVSFQPGGYGQRARRAELAFEVEAEASAAGRDGDGDGGAGAGLTMVLLVGSTLWFEDQAAMYDFMQPRLAAALAGSHGYDPSLQGPCMGGRAQGQQGQQVVAAVARRRRRRRLRGPEQQEEEGAAAAAGAVEEEGGNADGDGGIIPVPAAPSSSAADPSVVGAGLPSCADVVAAFNAADGLGGAAAPFAFLYTCNITTSTPHPPPAPQPDDGDASAGPAPAPQLLSYDQLRPEDYPFTYFVFINANVDDSSSSQLLRAGEEDGPSSRAVNQTVRYAATFSPSYTPTQATLPQPAFALLLLLCAVCFLAMSAWVSAPALDFLDRRGWLPRARA